MNSSKQPGPSLQERRAQSQRDKYAHSLRLQAAGLASIPKGPARKKQELFTQGALKSFQFAPRGHGYYDAFVQKPETAAVSATTGPATVITGYSSDAIPAVAPQTGTYSLTADHTVQTSHTGSSTLVLFNPGASGDVVGEILTLKASDPTLTTSELHVDSRPIRCRQFTDIGNLTYADTHWQNLLARNPDPNIDPDPTRQVEQIPLRGSLRIRNITEGLSVGGVVRMLRYNGGIQLNQHSPDTADNDNPTLTHPSEFISLCSMIRDAPRTKVFGGHELQEMHQSNTYPADFVRSMAFESSRHFRGALASPGYCTLMVLIDDFVSSSSLVNNSYEINVMVQRAARFGIGTLLGSMARELRVKGHDQVQSDHLQESSKPAALPIRNGVDAMVKKFGG